AGLVEELGSRSQLASVGSGSAGIDDEIAVMTAQDAKGLEFDAVVIVEPAELIDSHGAGDLYVAMTRPTTHLGLVHARPLPAGIACRAPSKTAIGGRGFPSTPPDLVCGARSHEGQPTHRCPVLRPASRASAAVVRRELMRGSRLSLPPARRSSRSRGAGCRWRPRSPRGNRRTGRRSRSADRRPDPAP